MNFIDFLLILLHFYMFCRLVLCLLKKGILNRDDLFYITSDPWEYKKNKLNEKFNQEGF